MTDIDEAARFTIGAASVVCVVFGLLACPRMPKPAPWPPALGDAGDACQSAEANLIRLGCMTADGYPVFVSPGGHHFADTCRARAAQGRDLRPECVARESFECGQLTAIFNLRRGEPCP